jgi:hypothetical protein
MKLYRFIAFAAAVLVNLMIARALNHSMVRQLVADGPIASTEQHSGLRLCLDDSMGARGQKAAKRVWPCVPAVFSPLRSQLKPILS